MDCVYRHAIETGAPGYAVLADRAVKAAGQPDVCELEALTAAAFFARMAALRDAEQIGEGHGLNFFGEVMLLREAFDRKEGVTAKAIYSGAAALRAFGMAADQGHVIAETQLATVVGRLLPKAVEMAKVWEGEGAEHQRAYDAVLRDAACGDRGALRIVLDEALAGIDSGEISPVEGLVIAEQCTRLAAAVGDDHLTTRLSGVLLMRSYQDQERGRTRLSLERVTDAVRIIALMAERGEPLAVKNLAAVIEASPPEAVTGAAKLAPFVLSALTPKGDA